ncbi:MAG: VWA domain-containing protein [Bryobacterales bacterium]|nr:VWA domain-containing protein [Bryobacterales bacterium]
MGRLHSLALIPFAAALAQEPQRPVFRSDVKLVRLLATVKDLNGTLVGGLDKNDFTILDNGVKQEIAVFERYTEQPLSIAVLLDTSASIAKDLKFATASLKRFLHAVIQDGNPRDEAALFTFNHDVRQHTGFTRRIQQIEDRVKPLKAEAGTSLYDAIYLAAQSLESREGRRVLVIVTDGGDTTSHYRYHDALKAAHLADAPIYSLLLMPILNDVGRNIGGENALTTLGQSTGGRLFTPTVGAELDQALAEILKDLRTQYSIGYYPKNIPVTKEKFHSIRLDLPRRDLRAVTRSGYYE